MKKSILALALPLIVVCSPARRGEDFDEFRSRELRCVIGNNKALGQHRAGYNGVFQLTSVHQQETLFVPDFAGLNLEHIYDASDRGADREVFFEPRFVPMSFRRIDERTAELHQPATPTWQVESTTTFRLEDPYYIDVTFRCIPRRDHFTGGAFGLFWASYINGPLDKSMYFLRDSDDGRTWQQFCTQLHNHDSTVRYQGDSFQWNFPEGFPTRLFTEISPILYSEPFFYGRFRNMVFIVIFERADGVRFSHSPSGGGENAESHDTNPAWDFQWVIPDYEVGRKYQLRYRVVYKPWVNRADVLSEVARFRDRAAQH